MCKHVRFTYNCPVYIVVNNAAQSLVEESRLWKTPATGFQIDDTTRLADTGGLRGSQEPRVDLGPGSNEL